MFCRMVLVLIDIVTVMWLLSLLDDLVSLALPVDDEPLLAVPLPLLLVVDVSLEAPPAALLVASCLV